MSETLQALRKKGRAHFGGLVFDTYEDAVLYSQLCPDIIPLPDLSMTIEEFVYRIQVLPTLTETVYELYAQANRPKVEEPGTLGYITFTQRGLRNIVKNNTLRIVVDELPEGL